MKNKVLKKYYFSLFLLLGCAVAMLSFSSYKKGEQDCLQQIRDFYSTINSVSKQGITHISFSVKTIMRPSEKVDQPITNSEVEMFCSGNQSRYISKEISVFEDETNSFTVIPNRKEIYWGNSVRNLEKDKRERKLFILQDTLFDLCTIKECKKIAATSEGCDQLIVIGSNEKLKKIYDISTISFWYNSSSKQVKKILIAYPNSIPIISMEANFKIMDYNYQGNDLSTSVKKLFIKSGDQLIEKYKGYKLIDNRIKN